jgi:hypothetical protein
MVPIGLNRHGTNVGALGVHAVCCPLAHCRPLWPLLVCNDLSCDGWNQGSSSQSACKAPLVKFSARYVKQRELTDTEKVGLRSIGNGAPVDAALCKRLKRLGLAELKQNVWKTTQQGNFELMFQKAR